jgi:hypothetical protein
MTRLPKGPDHVDDRGAATALSHVLVIGITAVLLSGLLVGLSTFVDGQQEASTREQLETIGSRVADQLARVDSLGARGQASIHAEFPDRVNQNRYTLDVVPPDDCDGTFVPEDVPACLELEAPDPGVTVYVPLDNRTAVSVSDPDSGSVRLASAGPGTGSSTGTDKVPLTKLSPRVGVAGNIGDFGFNTSFRDFNAEPEPAFEVTPEFPTSDTPVTLNGSPSTDPDGTIVSYEWDVDGDDNYEETGERVTRTFEPGDYEISLRVTDDKGATVTSESENVSISGLEYQDDLAAGGDGVVSFTVRNEWDRPVELSELFIDPDNDGINELEASGNDEITIDIGADGSDDGWINYEDGGGDPEDQTIRDVGFIADLDQPDDETRVDGSQTIPADTEAEITIDQFDQGMGDETITFAVDYIVDGGTRTTRFTDTTAPGIGDYQVIAPGQDVDVTFRSSSELGDITVEVGGAVADDTLTESDFTETDLGDAYEYTADIDTGVTGTVYANLTAAESADGVASPDPPLNDTVTASPADYRWYTADDWNNNYYDARVVHDNFGDREADQVMLGYPDYDRRADRYYEPRSLVGYWTFDEDGGDTVTDVTGNGFDGEVKGYGNTDASNNDPTRGVTGIHGTSSWKFNDDSGSEDEVLIDDPGPDSRLDGGNGIELTASAWINFQGSVDIDTPGGKAAIIGKSKSSTEGDWALIVTDQPCPSWAECSGSPPYVGYYGERNGNDYGLLAEVPSDSQWHHVAIDVNDYQDEVEVTIDGNEVANTFDAPESYTTETDHPVEIGRTEYDDANLKAKVDEVRLYDRELSDDEVEDLYEAGSSGRFLTSAKTGPPLDTEQMALTHDGEIEGSEQVTVTIYAFDPGPGASGGYEEVDEVTLTSDSGTTLVNPGPGSFDGTADEFYLDVELNSPSPAGSPEIDSLGLVDTS